MIQQIFNIVKKSNTSFGEKFIWLTVCKMSIKMWEQNQAMPTFMQNRQEILVYLTPEMGVGNFQSAKVDKQRLQDIFDNSDFEKEFPNAKLVAEILTYKNPIVWGEENSMILTN